MHKFSDWAAFKSMHPALAAAMETKNDFDFLTEMAVKIKSGETLTDKQFEALARTCEQVAIPWAHNKGQPFSGIVSIKYVALKDGLPEIHFVTESGNKGKTRSGKVLALTREKKFSEATRTERGTGKSFRINVTRSRVEWVLPVTKHFAILAIDDFTEIMSGAGDTTFAAKFAGTARVMDRLVRKPVRQDLSTWSPDDDDDPAADDSDPFGFEQAPVSESEHPAEIVSEAAPPSSETASLVPTIDDWRNAFLKK